MTYLVVLFVMIDTQNVNFFPSLLLVGAITVPMSVLVLAYQAGPQDPVPAWAAVFTASVGGVIGVLAAGMVEYDTLRSLGALPMVLTGVIEEAAKVIVPVILYLLWRPKDPRGGVIIGIASGLGFATLETMGYGFQALLSGHRASISSRPAPADRRPGEVTADQETACPSPSPSTASKSPARIR